MLQCRHAQEFSFGPRALKDALISTNPALQELYTKAFSSAEKLFLSEAYNPQRTIFCTLLIRTAFDWILSRPDAPEDFETFYHSMLRRKQSFYRKHIYLQPIDLTEGSSGISLLDSLRSCVESFFLGLRVKCLPSIPISSIRCCFRQNQDSDRVQLHTDGILNFLKNNKPMDALCVLGLTLVDLYPCETWSFTFSKFLPEQEVGVCSFARFSGDFPQAGCSALNPALRRGKLCEVTEKTGDRTLLFSMLEMVQCCKKLYAWTQTVLSAWATQEPTDLSAAEDLLPFSSDSGMCCENDSEAVTSLSEPLTPDTCSQALSIGQELEHDEQSCSLADTHSEQELDGTTKTTDIIKEYELWLEMCIAALERNVSEEELAQVDQAVDALARWEMFTGQLPTMKKDLPFTRDSVGLRKVLGDKFSSLRRKLSSRRLPKGESSPHRWRWEEN
ncbi:archaemetzincin-1 isoform X2 [Alligator sinensis]|uniref:Archaemetzincin-1 isoform X2 n=1 Tax=Alligator sinensis TaxID=38654 RepID=A0A3Q0HIK8_ALLSI|nr:archaemetzincin-1 isoform X2 [Alligator sinensis]